MKNTNIFLFIIMLSVVTNAQAGFIPLLLDADLNDKSTYAKSGVNLGANTDVGGYVMAGTIVDTGVGSVVEGNIYSGTTTNSGGTSLVKGDTEAGGKFKISAFAKVNGVITDSLANNN
jgi:NDP-sugar pyrophosphorylase family protein